MNLFWREMKAHRKSLIIWSVCVFVLMLAGMQKYDALYSGGQGTELIDKMPKALKAIFGMGNGSLDLSTAAGFYGLMFVYLLLMAAFHGTMLGSDVIGKEERDKTAEFLLAKPISRTEIISYKLLAALAQLVIFNLVSWLSSYLSLAAFGDEAGMGGKLALMMGGLFLMQLLFLALGSALSASAANRKRAGSLGTAVILVTYILSFAVVMNDKLDFLKYVSPFQYFSADQVVNDGAWNAVYLILSVVFTAAMTWFMYAIYRKRDMQV
ncbi:ABC transporter permease subunit [Gorillibacterium massiliense]|uniref:ABC transporter permease subunit n=1 Tax=Gorillibacterium massiliense TaxID=1280390 RepID=UPI0004B6329C|nr:ABC transporter permease subunit [Gorillibacterium massiliense]